MSTNLEGVTRQFLRFIHLSNPLLSSLRPSLPKADFQRFVHESIPLIIGPIRTSLTSLGSRIKLISRWLVAHDLLEVAGFSYAEDPYTELMKWALDPSTHHESALLRQRAWLETLGLAKRFHIDRAAIPRTQFWTDDGIPDLILEYDKFVVVLEAKTGSEEHEAPSGILQTMAYPDAVRRAVHIDRSKPVYIVFITPDKSEAANPEAINTTFVEFALSLAAALETIPLPDDLRFAYAMLFTHFLTYAVPPGIDTRSVVQKMDGWVVGAADDTYLVSIMGEVSAVAKLFGVEML